MKHLLKKGLSLFLAVLMVVSMLPMDALAVAFVSTDEDTPARVEEPVLDVGDSMVDTLGGQTSRDDREAIETPDPGDGDEPADPFWANVELKAVLMDASTGEVQITAKLPGGNESNAGLGNATIVLAPSFGTTTLTQLQAAGKINIGDTEATLIDKLQTQGGLGVDGSLIYILDVSSDKFDKGVWTHTATLGTSYADYIASAGNDTVTELTGIPMEVMLISQGDNPAVCIAEVTIQPQEAILKVDGEQPDVVNGDGVDTIYLDSTATQFVFDIKHTEASTETAIIRSITWEGPDIGTTNQGKLAAQVGSLANPGSKTITVDLPYSTDDGAGVGAAPWVGDVVIGYNDAINNSYRYLRVHVRPFPMVSVDPIEITVIRGGDPVSGGPVIGTGGVPFVIIADDEINMNAWGMTDGSQAATANKDGITLDIDSSFTGGYHLFDQYIDHNDGVTLVTGVSNPLFASRYGYYDMDTGEWVDGDSGDPDNPSGVEGIIVNEDTGEMQLAGGASWPSEGASVGDIVTAQAAADAALGTYTAGSVRVHLYSSDPSVGSAYVDIPVILTVKDPDSYQAIFSANGGTWKEGDGTTTLTTDIKETTDPLKKGTQVTPLPPDPTRTDYTFVGWGKTSGAGESDKLNDADIKYSTSATSPERYYAIWKANATKYTLKYNPNNGTGGPGDDVVSDAADTHTFDLEFTNNLPTRAGYVFAGWADLATASKPDYTAAGTTQVTVPKASPTKTVYAVWTAVYTVTYAESTTSGDPQLGAGLPTDANTYKTGDPVTVKYATGAAVGAEVDNGSGLKYKFTGWTRSDSGALVTGSSLNMPGSVLTLTATWEPVMLTVTYDLKGGTQGTPPTTDPSVPARVQKGADYTILAGDPTRTNYTFKGWTASGGGTATGLKKNDKVEDVSANLTLTAVWERDQSDIAFALDGGTLSGYPKTYTGDTGTALAAASFPGTPTKAGYTFSGWKGDDGTTYTSSSLPNYPAAKGGVLTITAQWTRDSSAIIFDLAGGNIAGDTNAIRKTGNTGDTLPAGDFPANPAKAGYSFAGWKGGDGKTYTSSNLPKFPDGDGSELTITAQWTADDNEVAFRYNYTPLPDGTSEPYTTQNIATGGHPTKPAVDPTRYGYNFEGWYKEAACTNKVTDFSAETITAATVYYANWTAKDVTVVYDAVHGTDPDSDTVAFATTGHTLKTYDKITGGTWTTVDGDQFLTVTESGAQHVYRFDGWTRDGTTAVTSIDIDEEGPITVTAMWTEQFTVTYTDGGHTTATDIPSAATALAGTEHTVLAGPTGTHVHSDGKTYQFKTWKQGSTERAPSSKVTVNSNITLVAEWTEVTYTVTYEKGSYTPDGGSAIAITTWAGLPDAQTGVSTTAAATHNVSAAKDATLGFDADGKGYTFLGWVHEGAEVAKNGAIKVDGNETLTARWEPKTYTVTYAVGNAGTAGAITGDTTYTVQHGASHTVKDASTLTAAAADNGWQPNGWDETNASITVTKDVTITGQWKVRVSSDADVNSKDPAVSNVTGMPSSVQWVDYGGKATKSGTNPSSDNWNFQKWVTASGGSTEFNFTNTAITAPTVIYASWGEKPTTAIFDLNYVTSDPPKVTTLTGTPGSNVTTGIPSTTRDGWRFDGWFDKASGDDATKVNTPTFPAAGNPAVTYYAHWTQLFTVTYDMKGHGTNPGSHTDVPDGTKVTTKSVSDVTGYTFKGWDTDPAGATVVYAAGAETAAITANTTLYAVWTANAHKVTYAPGKAGDNVSAYIDLDATTGGNQTEDAFTYGAATLNAKTADVVKWTNAGDSTGWNFQGWLSDETTPATYAANAALGTNAKDYDFTLTAQWTIDVSYDANLPEASPDGADGLSVPTTPAQIAPDGSLSAAQIASPGNLTNWTFAGWYTTPDDTTTTGTKVDTSTSFDKPSTVYARWTANLYDITYVDNDEVAGNPTPDTDKPYNSEVTLPSAGTKTGYTTTGWYDKDQDEAATATKVGDAGDKYTVKGDATLYAHWTPADVTIEYKTDVGTAPGSDSKKYDATDYNAKNKNTIQNTAGDGWNAGETIFTDDDGNRWQFNKWVVLDKDGAATNKSFISGAAINPVNTANGVVKTTTDDGDTYTLTLKADWTQLFSVTYANGGHGTVNTSAYNFVNQPSGPNTTLKAEVAIPAGTDESWSGAYFTDASGHWKFTTWQDQDGNDVGANTSITVTKDLVLTAQWEKTHKVTLAPPVLTDTTTELGIVVNAKFDNAPKKTGTENTFAWVKAGDGMDISELSLDSNEDDYIFAKWTQTSDTEGDFTTAAAGTSKDDTFTPKADTTLTPNYWRKPALSPASDWYHLNFAKNDTVNKAGCPVNGQKNEEPAYTWTKNNATLDDVQIQIKIDGTWTDLTLDTDVVATADASGNVTYVFQDAYLKNNLTVPAGDTSATYQIRVNSHTPNNADGTVNKEDTVLEADLVIYVNPDPLKRVDIWATNGTSINTTANVNADTGRNRVEYKVHDPLTIEKDNKLTYTWYYGDTPATQQAYYTNPANNNAANVAVIEGRLPTDKNLLSGLDNTVTHGDSAPVTKAELKGKYIYAMVVATDTGYGAAITNPIAVDYDAVVKVQQDGTAIAGDNKGNYSIWLVPHKNDNADTYAKGALPTGSVAATAKDGLADGLYQTDDSALTGGVTYDVYANKVEGNDTIYVKVPSLSVSTQINEDATNPPTVNFYSVNAVDTDFDHAEDDTQEVGEDFTGDNAAPGTKFTTAGAAGATIDVDSAKGVLSGTTVTAAADDTWAQDYLWNWGEDHTSADEPTLSYGTEKQTSGNATKNYAISAKSWIGGELEQKVYTIVGDIKGSGGKVATATLTFEKDGTTYTFTGTMTNGEPGDKVTFKAPKSGVTAGAITGNYTLKATGASDPRTTVSGYCKPAGNTATDLNSITLDQVTADTDLTGGSKGDFTIFIDASNWQLQVVDDHKAGALLAGADDIASVSRAHTSPVTDPAKVQYGDDTTAWTKTFANYNATTDQLTYNVTVSNPGNTNLTVSLAVKKTVSGTTTTIFDSATALTGDKDTNDVAFADLAASFDLAAKITAADGTETIDKKTFTVTIPADLDNDDDVTYSFEFTSVDKDDNDVYGPSLTYNLALTVNPIPVKSVGIDAKSDGTFAAKDLVFDATSAPLDVTTGGPTLSTANDLTYQWYVGTEPQLNSSGVITNASALTAATGTGNATATYTPAASDGGKDLWLVVSGHDNASNAAKASVKAPYKAAVTILEDTTGTTDYNSYKVYLVPSTVTTQPTDWTAAGIVEATHKDDDDQGVFTTGAELVAGTTYNVWTNVVKGTTDAVYQNSGALGAIADGVASKTVTYHSVTISETTYDNQYAGLKGTDFFGTGDDGSTAAAQTGNTGITATAAAGATAVANGGWVIKGTEVDFTHAAWTKDYTLKWTGATKQGTDAAGGGSAAKATVNANTAVSAELTLTLYKVTAYAVGAGTVNYITMTASGTANNNVFTTKTDNPNGSIMAIGTSRGSIDATTDGAPVVFSVPGGSYTAEGNVTASSGTTLDGYHETHGASELKKDPITKNISGVDTFDVVLTSTGVGLNVTDNDATDKHSVQGMYAGDAVTATADPYHTETLEYGYSGTKDIVLTLANVSANDATGHKQLVYKVAGKGGDADGSPASGVTWTSTDLSVDGTTTTIGTLTEDDSPTVTLTIPNGLAAGTYTYNAVFTFAAEADGDVVGTLTYPLVIVVNPAEFDTVTMKYDGESAALDTSKVLEAGKDLALFDAETKVNDVFDALTFTDDAKDYHYAWYASTDGTLNKTDDLTWTDTDGSVALAGATDLSVVDQNLTAATIADHQSEYLYLVIYATANNGKVIEAAVSDPVRAGFEGVVQIQENGALQTSEPKTGDNAKYTVTLTDSKSNELKTKWSDDAQGYVAWDTTNDKAIHLDPAETYTAKVSAYEGAAAGATEALTKTIKGDDLANDSHITTAEYFTVTAVATTAQHHVDAVADTTFDADHMPKTGLSIGGADVDGKTVLKGQDVTAKFAAVSDSKAWTQDYDLTWQDKKDNDADGSSLDDTKLTDTAATAVSGGQTWTNITAKTYIGGRLDQKVYEITGSIVGTGSVASVVMTDGNDNANTTEAGGTINKDDKNTITNTNNNSTTGDQGDTITLFVVKGTYGLQVTASEGTTVRGIEWAGGAFESGASVSDKDVPTGTTFVVYLDAASSVLRVQDTHTTPTAHTADSNAARTADNFKHADHKHEVYFSAMTADDVQTVELENRGNTALTLDTPTLWKVDDGKTLADVKWADWANANPVTELGTDGAYSLDDVIAITNALTDDNKTLGAATAAADGTLSNFKKVTAGTVTVSQNVDVADSGIYIIRYTTGDGGPVVYYVLNLVVKALPITAVTTDTPSEAPGAEDKVQIESYTGDKQGFDKVMVDDDGNNTTAAVAASTVADPALTDGTDVKYQWVKAKTQMTATQVKDALKVEASGVVATANTVTVLSDNGADSKQYTVQSADVDSYLYLVAYAPVDTVVNATDFAVSGPIKTKETKGVRVKLNGDVLPISGHAKPDYDIYLMEDGKTWSDPVKETDCSVTLADGVWATTWSDDANRLFQAAVDVTKTYHVYAPTYQGSATYVDTGLTVGKDVNTIPEVPYWSVKHTTDVAVKNTHDGFAAYLPDSTKTGAEDNAIQEALTVQVSTTKGGTTYTDTLAGDDVPVLEGMNVKVTVDAAAASANTADGVRKSWSEATALHTLHTFGWKNGATDSGAGVAADGIAYPAGVGDPAAYLIQSGDITVNAAKTFTAQLDQTLFDVTFDVVDNTPAGTDLEGYTPGVKSATLTSTEAGSNLVLNHKSIVPPAGANGAKVTFEKVPVGAFEIKAVGQDRTSIDGYTWNATGDNLNKPVTPGKIVNVAGGADADVTNKHAGNTIQIQYSSNSIKWMDNFDDTNGGVLADNAFVDSDGFEKVNTPTTGPWLALKDGYKADDGDVLAYKVRVVNNGVMPLNDFQIQQTTGAADLTAGLTTVRVFDGKTGEPKEGTVDLTKGGFTLQIGDWVEFDVEIPEGQAPSGTNYASHFEASHSGTGKIAGGDYDPEYQVRPTLEFQPGGATVEYGGKEFVKDSATDISSGWQTSYGTEPNFEYDVLTEEELAAYLNGADRPANAYTKDGMTDEDHKKPDWLVLNTGDGKVSFDGTLRANDVNVQVKGTPADFDAYDDPANGHKVDNEVILYIKAVDKVNNETYYTTYTVNVEPGQLKIVGDSFTPATSYIGQSVNKGEFTYTGVTNQIDEDVVAAADIAGDGDNTANGNTAAKDGWVVTGADKTPTASWSVDPTLYEKDKDQYRFTVTYKKDTAAEKWNYKPATVTKTITPQKPPMDLKFSDKLAKASYEPEGAEVLVGIGTEYSENVPNVKPEYAPSVLNPVNEAFRLNEHIVYLDTEPRYNVTLTGVGDIYGVQVERELVGFQELDSNLSFTDNEFHEAQGATRTFALELTPMPGTTSKYVGVHTATYTVTGYGSAAEAEADPNREHPGVTATYTLTIEVKPKVIAEAHVTDLDDPEPGNTPDTDITLTAKDPEGKDIKPTTPDKHGNTPIVPVVTWTDSQDNPVDPTKPFEDDKDYKVKVDLPADPNYTFEDLTEPEEEPNYTLNGKTDVNDDPDLVDEDLTITITSENDPPVPDRNKQVTFEKTTELPKFAHLEFEDVNADNAADNMPHAVNVERPTITVKRGDALGKYIISLGAYDNAVTDVKLTQVDGLPTGAVWSLTPDAIDRLDDVTATPAGDKQSYTLDLSGVYTVDLDAKLYTLELKAEGQDANYPDRAVTPATYKITIQVLPADPSKLMVKDLRKDGTGTGTDNKITPAENEYAVTYTREITVKWDKDSGWWYPLGTYDIDLGASVNDVRDLELNSKSGITSNGVLALGSAIKEFNANVGKLDKGDVWSFALDLSDVDYHTVNTDATEDKDLEYVELTATGKDLNGATVKATYKLTLKFEVPPKPELKFDDVKQGGATSDPATTGPEVNDTRTISATEGTKLGKYTIYLGAYNAGVKVTSITSTRSPNLVYDVTPDCATVTPVTLVERKSVGDAQAFELDLSGMDTKPGTYTLTLNAQGVDLSGKYTVNASYTLTITIRAKGGGGGGGGGGSCPSQVTYLLGLYGTTKDATMEMVSGKSVKSVPNVSALEGYKFLGWSLTGPSGNAEQDAKRTLVDPKSVTINGDTTFYAVYQVLYKVPQPPFHKHYVIGYPNGNFGPADNIDRASVATIIARAVLPNFVEGADYGNPGGYSDVNGHWAASAIAYCSKYGVFKGYDDGTFKPSQPISRQELALVMASIGGIKKGSAPFSDIATAGDWAKDGIYTAYANGWVNGYTDGTFKPLNPIRRDETVKIFNAYLHRGVDAEGLSALTEYVHSGVASNITENGTTEYMTWPDVTKDQWAYYEIIEAANDHEFEVDATQPNGYAVPEQWTKCWIDEKWRYHDDANDGGPSTVVSALTRKFGAAD